MSKTSKTWTGRQSVAGCENDRTIICGRFEIKIGRSGCCKQCCVLPLGWSAKTAMIDVAMGSSRLQADACGCGVTMAHSMY